ncbi:hypothetical protein KBY58_03290 [Cyanobium sp. HWJ4-Hawea]|uniref:hypothetical protein n=1 Tax=Cyanobium sp. HWJ4-Hawea TaxID=2823713 RepID=UPI0020CF798C|nr:hypothetical protein [Cyanobium sp. HWJ4-Hawea]MCP9808457.1 hypothetical protein [Cyanobium sp. HWJ4-Hawea]
MAVATAAAKQGIPACCGISKEVASKISTWEEQGGENRDLALAVKSLNHLSQPKPCAMLEAGAVGGQDCESCVHKSIQVVQIHGQW